VPPGRLGEAPIREPGDLPSAVSTRQTPVGVYLWMIRKTQVFWSSLAPAAGGSHAQVMRGSIVSIIPSTSIIPSAGVPNAAPTVYVCVTCKLPGEPDSEPRPGTLLAAATEHAAAGTDVKVRRLHCLANCTRGPSAAMRANGSWTYVFGGLDVSCAPALIAGARLLAAAADGILPWRGRPDVLKRGLIARVPPLGFEGLDQ
jgi:predicted metal-binding protein